MGRISGVYLTPHPPIIVDEIGKEEHKKVQRTIDSMEALGKEIGDKQPDTIIIISPHGPVFTDGIGLMTESKLWGDFSRFGASEVSMTFTCDRDLANEIINESQKEEIMVIGMDDSMCSTYNISHSLDWGVLVPLYYVNKYFTNYKLVAMGSSQLSFDKLYMFGMIMKRAIESMDRDVIIIASGDLSHRLKEDGPYGYHPAGEELDQAIVSHIEKQDIEGLLTLDSQLIAQGGECGLASIIMAIGALDGQAFKSKVLSYEGPFGVGYCVASFQPSKGEGHRRLTDGLGYDNKSKSSNSISNGDIYVKLAKKSLEAYVCQGKTIDTYKGLPKSMIDERAGVFVTIKSRGRLRGCIGTIEPTRENIAQEIIYNSISAGTEDPRFPPVKAGELENLVFSVDVLKKPEPIESLKQLDVKKYGIIVSRGIKRGLLLPNIEGIDSPDEQLSIALQKAGIGDKEDYLMERFEVVRHL